MDANWQRNWLHVKLCVKYRLHLLQGKLTQILLAAKMIISWLFAVNTFADIMIIWGQVDTGNHKRNLTRWQRVKLAAYLSRETPSVFGACSLLGHDHGAESVSWCAVDNHTMDTKIWHIDVDIGDTCCATRVQWLRDKIITNDHVELPFGALANIHRDE